MWSLIKLKRAARSTLAAETLALSDGCDAFYFIASLAKEKIFSKKTKQNIVNIEAYTDNLSLYEILNTTKSIFDRRL